MALPRIDEIRARLQQKNKEQVREEHYESVSSWWLEKERFEKEKEKEKEREGERKLFAGI